MHYFEFLADNFKDVQVVSFNIFFHGQSELKEDHLDHHNLKAIFDLVIENESINHFSVIGYSLGGKFALNLVNYYPEKIDQVILIAAEGIKAHNFYNLTCRIWLLRRLYKTSIEHPNWFFNLAHFLRRIRVFSPSMIKFIELQMGEKEQREMAYNTWAKFRYVFPNQGRLKNNFHDFNIDLIVMIGERDRIIKPDVGNYFIQKMGKGEFRVLPMTHDIFRKDYLQILMKELEHII
ncbi:MAG: alpha/beta hydrolase [Crocinitomicaceae bacterium]|nr:alpha/beta hydrolase [Crocinitomicaceae bacterium]